MRGPFGEKNVRKIKSALPLYLIDAHSFVLGYFFVLFPDGMVIILNHGPLNVLLGYDKPPLSVGNTQLCGQCDALALKEILQKILQVDNIKQESGCYVEGLHLSDKWLVSFELSWFGRAASLSRSFFKHAIF